MQNQPEFTSNLERAAFSATRWIGSTHSLVVHTAAFLLSFGAVYLGFLQFDRMLLILTTLVSLEAIYLAIFIQMTVNRTTESLSEVEHDIDEIQEDVDEIQEDIDELQEDVEEMSEEDKADEERKRQQKLTLEKIHGNLSRLLTDLETVQKRQSEKATAVAGKVKAAHSKLKRVTRPGKAGTSRQKGKEALNPDSEKGRRTSGA